MNEEKLELPEGVPEGFIVLRRTPGQNDLSGLIEQSFSMDWSKIDVRFWWSGKAYSILGEHLLDGKEDAQDQVNYYQQKYPDDEFFIYDVRDPTCPVELDWIPYLKNREYARSSDPKIHRNFCKHNDRNILMKMK